METNCFINLLKINIAQYKNINKLIYWANRLDKYNKRSTR